MYKSVGWAETPKPEPTNLSKTYQFDLREDAQPGRPEILAPGIRRIVAPNPSPMTFTGTATYLVGEGAVALIDPGPDDPAHLDRVLASLAPGESVEAIFVTHRHVDHAPGARPARARTGVPVYAARAQPNPTGPEIAALLAADPGGGGEGIHPGFEPDRVLADGDLVTSSQTRPDGQPAWTLGAVHTPGHLDDHLCFALEEAGALFTGDHVMGWSSSMLSPPEGSHGDYMQSLERLSDRVEAGADRIYYPGHGNPVPDPGSLVRHLAERRWKREAGLLEMLDGWTASLAQLLARTYPGFTGTRAHAARRNLLAHLIDMRRRGFLEVEEGGGEPRFTRTET